MFYSPSPPQKGFSPPRFQINLGFYPRFNPWAKPPFFGPAIFSPTFWKSPSNINGGPLLINPSWNWASLLTPHYKFVSQMDTLPLTLPLLQRFFLPFGPFFPPIFFWHKNSGFILLDISFLPFGWEKSLAQKFPPNRSLP